jgi:hypothetical protein
MTPRTLVLQGRLISVININFDCVKTEKNMQKSFLP